MTRKELLQTIEDIENGLAMNPTGEILERLTNRLERAKNQLSQLDQKKSDLEQPTRNLNRQFGTLKNKAKNHRENGREEIAKKIDEDIAELNRVWTHSATNEEATKLGELIIQRCEGYEADRLKALHEKAQNEKLNPEQAEKVGNEMIEIYAKQAERERELFFKKQAQEYRVNGREDLAKKVEQDIQNQHRDQEATARAFAPKIAAPKPKPERTVIIEMVKGEKEMNYSQVVAEAKRYANGLLTMKSYRAGSDIKTLDMGCNLIALYAAWVWFQDGKHPVVTDLLPQYNKYTDDNKGRADELLERLMTEIV